MTSWNTDIDVILLDSDDEDDEELRDFSKGREALLFVIDAVMLAHKNHLKDALDIVRKAFISALLVKDKDLMGVMFANTQHNPAPSDTNCLQNIVMPANCAVLLPVRQLTKATVEYLLQFIKTVGKTFAERYGYANGNFANMISLCSSLFDHCGYPCNNSTIVYLTDTELPHAVETTEYRRALMMAKHLRQQEVEFHVIPMIDDFNYDVFYKEFLTLVRDVELDSFDPPDARQLREILADLKLKQDFVRRSLCHFNFSLGPGLDISAQFFNYFKMRSYPRKVKVLRTDNSILKKKNTIIARKQNAETLEYIQEREVNTTRGWYEINVGTGPPILITAEQLNRVRNLQEPSMLLLGFKPASAMPENQYFKPSCFMYPDDTRIFGSKRLFRALWQRCYERQKIAICLFLSKPKSAPRYVALVPVAAQDDTSQKVEYNSLLSGDGFKIIYLPFGKYIRHINFTDWNSIENESPEEGVELFGNIIKKLRMKYEPNLINDPILEMLQAQLLALALNIPTESYRSTGLPDAQAQDERIKQYLPDFNKLFGEDATVATKKRTASNITGTEPEPKIPKITEADILSYDFVKQLIANKTLSACTATQLRSILSNHFHEKLPLAIEKNQSKKKALMDRILKLYVS